MALPLEPDNLSLDPGLTRAADPVDDDELTVYCGACSGSGEGRYDGSRCSICRGRGEVAADADDPEDRRLAREEDRAEAREW